MYLSSDMLKDMTELLNEVSEVRFSNKLKTHPVLRTTTTKRIGSPRAQICHSFPHAGGR